MSMRHTCGISLFYDTRVSRAVHANRRSGPNASNEALLARWRRSIAANTRGRRNSETSSQPGKVTPVGCAGPGTAEWRWRPPARNSAGAGMGCAPVRLDSTASKPTTAVISTRTAKASVSPTTEQLVERVVTVALLCILFDGGMHLGLSLIHI